MAARLAAGVIQARFPDFPGGPPAVRTLCWALAMAASSFLFLATYRKLDILSVFMGEVAAGLSADPRVSAAIRRWITLLVFWGGSLAIAGLVFFLSISILPSWQIVGLVGTVLAILVLMFRERLVSIYLAGQQAIEETFSAPKDHGHGTSHDSASLRPVEALEQMTRVTIPPGHPAIGLSLAELNLTSRPGPIVIGIGRGTHTVLYPEPEEQLQPGDQLAIVGSSSQIEFAKTCLTQPKD